MFHDTGIQVVVSKETAMQSACTALFRSGRTKAGGNTRGKNQFCPSISLSLSLWCAFTCEREREGERERESVCVLERERERERERDHLSRTNYYGK